MAEIPIIFIQCWNMIHVDRADGNSWKWTKIVWWASKTFILWDGNKNSRINALLIVLVLNCILTLRKLKSRLLFQGHECMNLTANIFESGQMPTPFIYLVQIIWPQNLMEMKNWIVWFSAQFDPFWAILLAFSYPVSLITHHI